MTRPAVMAKDFVTGAGQRLGDLDLKQPKILHDPDDVENADYLVGVNWIKTLPISQGKWFDGGFANQNVVCKLRHPATLEFLAQEFG